MAVSRRLSNVHAELFSFNMSNIARPTARLFTARLFTGALALAAAGSLALSGCSQTKDAATDAGEGIGEMAQDAAGSVGDAAESMGDAAKQVATDAARTTLAPAVNPMLDLLNKGQDELKAGNMEAVASTMGGFDALWSKASPVIQPLAGDKWPAIESGAKTLSSTFAGGASPDASMASSAISGLMGPLQGLMGK